jgi:hypothetical protein
VARTTHAKVLLQQRLERAAFYLMTVTYVRPSIARYRR